MDEEKRKKLDLLLEELDLTMHALSNCAIKREVLWKSWLTGKTNETKEYDQQVERHRALLEIYERIKSDIKNLMN